MSLPHITNSKAGVNKWDPMHNSLFEVYFTIPEALRGEYANDEMLITEHVKSISGLESLDKGPAAGEQKYMGTSRSYIQPKLDNTYHELEVIFTLNLRNGVDNYIYNLFKAWKNLNYNLETGEISLKRDYTADWLKISIANRTGVIIREIIYKDVMLIDGITGMNELSYEGNDAVELTVKFRSDWAREK